MFGKKSNYEASYRKTVYDALSKTYQQASQEPMVTLDLSRDKFIIFSDQHRGFRNRADDFRVAERAYNAALAYYFRQGYTLVVLGDAEELWEERPSDVLRAYRHSLLLEAKFHQAGRYLRFWGNHDDLWQYPDMVQKRLEPIFGSPLKVYDSLIINVVDQGDKLGQLFLLHGHQGTVASDRFGKFSKLFVRYIWRNYQRITGVSLNTPAQDWALRERHNIALYSWSADQNGVILIAGHTHRPVFKSQSHPDDLLNQLELLEADLQKSPYNPELIDQISRLAAQLEWVRAQESGRVGAEGGVRFMKKPSYFNTGCCSFSDGDITGIAIADGQIQLVHLPDENGDPFPIILEEDSLRDVLVQCRADAP